MLNNVGHVELADGYDNNIVRNLKLLFDKKCPEEQKSTDKNIDESEIEDPRTKSLVNNSPSHD